MLSALPLLPHVLPNLLLLLRSLRSIYLHFTAATDVSAIAITKLDGTAKGGVVLAIANQFKIPVKFIGVGEKMTDLLVFDKHEFVDSLFDLEK